MKRKREDEDDEEESSSSTESAIESNANLSRMPKELLESVCSFLNLRERHVMRRVSSRFWRFIDGMEKDATDSRLEIHVKVLNYWELPAKRIQRFCNDDKVVKFKFLVEQGREDTDDLISLLPCFRSIKPSYLCVRLCLTNREDTFTTRYLDPRLMRHLAKDFAGSVSRLYVSNLQAMDATAVVQAFSLFKHVKQLEIEGTSLSASRLVARSLQNLENLELKMQAEVNPESDSFEGQSIGTQLDSLGTLARLQHLELSWHTSIVESALRKDALLGALVGCSALKNLKYLDCGVIGTRSRDDIDQYAQTLAVVLSRLVNLEYFWLPVSPRLRLLCKLIDEGVVHSNITTIRIPLSDNAFEDHGNLDSLKQNIEKVFPAAEKITYYFHRRSMVAETLAPVFEFTAFEKVSRDPNEEVLEVITHR